jgi:hypothetical protein
MLARPGHVDSRPAGTTGRLVRAEVGAPAAADELLCFGTARVRGEQDGGSTLVGADEQHLTGMRVRCPRLGEQVVTVVPAAGQPEVVHGREGGGAGADDDPDVTPGHGKEGAVPGGRSHLCREGDVAPGAEQSDQRRVESGDVAYVRAGTAEHRGRT